MIHSRSILRFNKITRKSKPKRLQRSYTMEYWRSCSKVEKETRTNFYHYFSFIATSRSLAKTIVDLKMDIVFLKANCEFYYLNFSRVFFLILVFWIQYFYIRGKEWLILFFYFGPLCSGLWLKHDKLWSIQWIST